MTSHDRPPILRVMPGPGDINANGHIFGGWVLSQMDIAAGIVASRRAKGRMSSRELASRTPRSSISSTALQGT